MEAHSGLTADSLPSCGVVGVLVLSWYPPGVADNHGEPTEDLVPAVMDAAHRHSLKVTGETTGMFFLSGDLLNEWLPVTVDCVVPRAKLRITTEDIVLLCSKDLALHWHCTAIRGKFHPYLLYQINM